MGHKNEHHETTLLFCCNSAQETQNSTCTNDCITWRLEWSVGEGYGLNLTVSLAEVHVQWPACERSVQTILMKARLGRLLSGALRLEI